MITTTVEVEIDEMDVLPDLSDEELVQELVNRDLRAAQYVEDTPEILRAAGCPEYIVDLVEHWLATPVANEFKLKEWKEFCHG